MAQQPHSSSQQGAVKDPEHDGRLKENREAGVHKGDAKSGSHSASSGDQGHTPGAVKDPEHDGRLKENRDKGIHKSDAESESGSHSGRSSASESRSESRSGGSESRGHTPGAVKDPEHDGRLKENRDKGVHKGD